MELIITSIREYYGYIDNEEDDQENVNQKKSFRFIEDPFFYLDYITNESILIWRKQLKDLYQINPKVVKDLLTYSIGKYIDETYESNILNSDFLYTINSQNLIVGVTKDSILYYKDHNLFRKLDEANYALSQLLKFQKSSYLKQ